MSSYTSYLTNRYVLAAVAIIVVVGSYFVLSGGGEPAETITIHPSDFVQQVSVSGKVIAAQDVDLGFTQSGRVASVRVAVGQKVSAGQTLAAIDNGDLYAAVLQKQAARDTQQAKLNALKQGTRPEEIAVAQSTVSSSAAALSQAQQAVADAIENAYIKSDDAVRNKVYQFVSGPRSSSPQLTFTTSDSQMALSVTSRVPDVEGSLNAWQTEVSGITAENAMQHVASAQSHLSSVSSFLGSASGALARALTSSTFTQATLDGYSADVATGRTNVNTALSSLTTAITAQKSAAAALDSAQKTLALKQAGTVQADIDAQAAQVKAAEADVVNAQAQLAKTLIVAPFSGVVTTVDAKVGMIVSPNTPEISLMSASTFQIESYVPEVNIALVKVGDKAVVTLDAYGESVPFAAKVVSIDPAETIKDGVPTYRSLLQFEESDPRIRSGMTANLVITTAQKGGVLSVPQGLVVERDGKRYVNVLENGTIAEREVTTGAVSSLGNIEVLTGLREGDVIVISEAE